MASKPIQKSALTSNPGNVKSIVLPVILSPADALVPRERIDVRPEFIDFKIASLTQEELIDTLGLVKRAGKDLEKWEKLAVDVVKAKAALPLVGEETVLPGDICKAVITCSKPNRLSLEKLVAKFGEAAIADCYDDSKAQYTLNIKPNV